MSALCLTCAISDGREHKCQRFIDCGLETMRCGHGCDPGPYFAKVRKS